MANFPTAAQARERGQGNRIITEEIALLEVVILDAIASGLLTKDYGGLLSDSTASTTTINGTTITASTMTGDNVTGESYYDVWKGTSTDLAKTEQMNEVIAHFENKGFTISRKSNNNTSFYWSITW